MRFICRVLLLLCFIFICGCAAKIQNGLISLNEFQDTMKSKGIEFYEFNSDEKLRAEELWGKHIWQVGVKRLCGENVYSQTNIPEIIVFANGEMKSKIDAVGIGMTADGDSPYSSKMELMSLMLEKLFPDWKNANIKKWLSSTCNFLPLRSAQLKEKGTTTNKTEYVITKGDKIITLGYQEESGCGKYLLVVQRKDSFVQDQNEFEVISSEWTPDFIGSFPDLQLNQSDNTNSEKGSLNPAVDFKISGVTLGDKADKVLGTFGNPVKTEIMEGSPTTEGRKLFLYDGLSLMLSDIDNSVIKIAINKNNLTTERGVKIGDEWSKVTDVYGEEYKKYREDNDFEIYQYANSDSIDRLWFKVDKVTNAVQEIVMVRQS